MILLAGLPLDYRPARAYLEQFDGMVMSVGRTVPSLPSRPHGAFLRVLDASSLGTSHAVLEVLMDRCQPLLAVIMGPVTHRPPGRLLRRLPTVWCNGVPGRVSSLCVSETPLVLPFKAAYRLPATYHHETDATLWWAAFAAGLPVIVPVDAAKPEAALLTVSRLRALKLP